MRFGELLALTLADFGFKDNTINIIVLVFNLDRLCRRTEDMIRYWNFLNQNKVRLCTVADGFVNLIMDSGIATATINITKSLQHKASGDIVTPPKTDNGIRTITMPEAIMHLPMCPALVHGFEGRL